MFYSRIPYSSSSLLVIADIHISSCLLCFVTVRSVTDAAEVASAQKPKQSRKLTEHQTQSENNKCGDRYVSTLLLLFCFLKLLHIAAK